jgi:hypothetical protein
MSDGAYVPLRASEAVTQATLSTFLLPVAFEALGYFSYARYWCVRPEGARV